MAIIAIGYSGGCASTTLPPALTASQRDILSRAHFGATIAVERYKFLVYSDGLVIALRDTGLFEAVDHAEKLRVPANLLARIERPIHGTAAIPLLTGISLGLIPTTVQEEHGYAFSFVSKEKPTGNGVGIEFSYSGPSTLGWWCLVLNLSPNRTSGDVKGHARFRDGLAWAVARRGDAIRALLKQAGA